MDDCTLPTARDLAGNRVTPPRVVGCAAPRSPTELRDQGEVVVRFPVDSGGVPDTNAIEIEQSTAPVFGAAARAAVTYLRFAPAGAGEARSVILEIPHSFTIEEGRRSRHPPGRIGVRVMVAPV